MENKVFKGVTISATSNKVNSDYKQEVDTKTAYLEASKETLKEMEKFGLRIYTSEKDKESFVIVKLADKLRVYDNNGKSSVRRDLSNIYGENDEENFNFKSDEVRNISVNIIKGENKGNTFHRLQAILVSSEEDIIKIEPENPFADNDGAEIGDDDLPF